MILRSFLFSILLVFSFNFSHAQTALSGKECNATSENFYQCIGDFIKQALPNNNWCTLLPMGKTEAEGFVLLTLSISSQGSFFSQSSYYFGNHRGTIDLGTATGLWSLENNILLMNYDQDLSKKSKALKLPNKIEVDFEDDAGEKLILSYTSDNPAEGFGPLVFTKCGEEINKQ